MVLIAALIIVSTVEFVEGISLTSLGVNLVVLAVALAAAFIIINVLIFSVFFVGGVFVFVCYQRVGRC